MELILNNLRKTYGTVQALKGISYTFKPGIYGILGANGAGKSTMINLITDNVSRDKKNGGSILYNECDGFEKQGESVQGTDILKLGKSFRAIVGYMPQQQGFYEDFSPRAFLKYMAEIKGIKKINTIDENGNAVIKTVKQQIDELIEIVNLTNVADKKIGGFSGGMKQRVLLAQALLLRPVAVLGTRDLVLVDMAIGHASVHQSLDLAVQPLVFRAHASISVTCHFSLLPRI